MIRRSNHTLAWLFTFCSLSLLFACVDDEEIIPEPEPEPIQCVYEFEANADGTACDCPPDKIQHDSILCYTLPEDYWYADMNGCPYPIGMAFGQAIGESDWDLADTTSGSAYDDGINGYRYIAEVIRPVRGAGDILIVDSPFLLYLLGTSTGYDSIIFTLSDLEWKIPGEPDPPASPKLQFRGKMRHPGNQDTLDGMFFWGYEDFVLDFEVTNTDSCFGTFIRPE
ncbi:hypothetical protein CEQ90_09610 [Lewinellaceae bacterium SD302]|nr:hypothetical protein CEQ90_09610 [Lewinellaceae bacterium SD302]